MAPPASLTCNFTISADFAVGVSFQSADNGASYGGLITVFTPATSGPVTTGLWDNDGNVFFTVYDAETPTLNCAINSGSTPGTWDPYVVVADESGLTCTLTGPQPAGDNSYDYTIAVARTENTVSA